MYELEIRDLEGTHVVEEFKNPSGVEKYIGKIKNIQNYELIITQKDELFGLKNFGEIKIRWIQ